MGRIEFDMLEESRSSYHQEAVNTLTMYRAVCYETHVAQATCASRSFCN